MENFFTNIIHISICIISICIRLEEKLRIILVFALENLMPNGINISDEKHDVMDDMIIGIIIKLSL